MLEHHSVLGSWLLCRLPDSPFIVLGSPGSTGRLTLLCFSFSVRKQFRPAGGDGEQRGIIVGGTAAEMVFKMALVERGGQGS